jgi:hypothetical protein
MLVILKDGCLLPFPKLLQRMPWYRVYFLGRSGDIRNVDEFDAPMDHIAITLADSIYDAVSDLYPGYVVWRDSQCLIHVRHRRDPRPFVSGQIITEWWQSKLLRRLRSLQKSETAFATSRRLVERINQLQDTVGVKQRRRAS